MRNLKHCLMAVCIALGLTLLFSSHAQNIFRNETTTAAGHSTWDADLINVEFVPQTGRGVYVAVLDSGLVPNWRDYFPEARVATALGMGFYQHINFRAGEADSCLVEVEVGPLHTTSWVGSNGSSHGTHVASTIIGYFYRSNVDAAQGFPLPPIMVRGIAPDVTIIPVQVLADYPIPALPKCGVPGGIDAIFGTESMVAAGIRYVTQLKQAGYSPMVITMSLGADVPVPEVKAAIDDAIANGVIVVVAAGNAGEGGMGYPGAYPPVISVGSVGWVGEWLQPTDGNPFYRMWWLQYPFAPLLPGSGDVRDSTSANDVYVSDFSSRALPGQELDVLAPGSAVRGPFEVGPGFSHLPWWSKSIADLRNRAGNLRVFFYVGGTSMATPHVASAAALMLQKNPNLTQAQIESILKSTALAMPSSGSRSVFDPADGYLTILWDTDCDGTPCDPVGAGVIQVDLALPATP